MPLTEAQRQAGDADLARRRATRAAIHQGNERVIQVNDLLDALETLADALTYHCRLVATGNAMVRGLVKQRDEARTKALDEVLAAHLCDDCRANVQALKA